MKQLASVPALKNHKFVIPATLCPIGERILSFEEIDMYISQNKLVFKPEDQHIPPQAEE